MSNATGISIVIAGSSEAGIDRAWLGLPSQAAEIEIIEATAASERRPGFPGIDRLQLPRGTTIPRLRAAGVREARHDVVVLTEDFCAPPDAWLDQLRAVVEAHSEATLIGGTVSRANGRPEDWALTFIEYGRFPRAGTPRNSNDLPGIQLVIRRDRVRELLGSLPSEWTETETHAALANRGAVLIQDPRWLIHDHHRVPYFRAIAEQRRHGRNYGGGRVAGRSFLYRLLRAGAAPLVPWLQFIRLWRNNSVTAERRQFLRASPRLLLLLCAWAVGEGQGFLFGRGRAGEEWT